MTVTVNHRLVIRQYEFPPRCLSFQQPQLGGRVGYEGDFLVQVACADMIREKEYRRLTHAIVMDTDAVDDLKAMRAYDRSAVLDVIERILSTTPTRESKSRIKRLRGLDSPAYRLRVGEFRVFYNVLEQRVQVLRVLPKSLVDAYLEEIGYETEGN